MRAVLVGNQNAGKSTLFNLLTNGNQKIGNWPGVTVERKSGIIQDLAMELVDLPGMYSLMPYTLEERISYGFLKNESYDLIINVVDVTSLERGLYLTTQLCELSSPVIVALNRMDKLASHGYSIQLEELQQQLQVDVCPISASHGTGIVELLKTIQKVAKESKFKKSSIVRQRTMVSFPQEVITTHSSYEKEITRRYQYIDRICQKCLRPTQLKRRREFLDRIFLHRIFAIPIFFLILFGMYYLAMDVFRQIRFTIFRHLAC